MTADDETLFVYRVALRRALAGDDPGALPLHFAVGVLERYRGQAGYSLIRTDTVARLRKQGDWSLDFGLAPDEITLQVAYADLQRLPAAEREHWASFATLLPTSKMYLQMRLSPSACYDDGEVRPWQ